MLQDISLLVETLMHISVHKISDLDDPQLDALEAAQTTSEDGLARLAAFRHGYTAKRAGVLVESCPFKAEEDPVRLRLRAMWLLGWTLRDLAESADDERRQFVSVSVLDEFNDTSVIGSLQSRLARANAHAARWKRFAKAMRHNVSMASELTGLMRRRVAQAMITEFLRVGGDGSVVEWKYPLRDGRGAFVMTMTRVAGPSAVDLINQHKARADAAEERVRVLEQQLAPAKET